MGQFTSQGANPMLMQLLQGIFAQGAGSQLGMGGMQRQQFQPPPINPLAGQPAMNGGGASTLYPDGTWRPGGFDLGTLVQVQNAMTGGQSTANIQSPQGMVQQGGPMTNPGGPQLMNQQVQNLISGGGGGMPAAPNMQSLNPQQILQAVQNGPMAAPSQGMSPQQVLQAVQNGPMAVNGAANLQLQGPPRQNRLMGMAQQMGLGAPGAPSMGNPLLQQAQAMGMNPQAMINPMVPQPPNVGRPMQAVPSFIGQPPTATKMLGGVNGQNPMMPKLPKFGEL